ncbi:MAG: hypothetical protein M4D80_34500 [Myxococcota bacterium]|nr:hypothetical protein [Myxococcota bacterium]
MRLLVTVVGLVLTACPKKTPDGPKPFAGVGCPAASGVFVASYLAPEEGTKGQGHTGWVLPLHDKTVDTLDGVAEYAKIDTAAAQAAGVPAPPSSLWLMLPNQAPCRLTFGSYYAAAIDAPTKNIAYGIELSGCAPPSNAQLETAIALASNESPGQCSVIAPKSVGVRVGTTGQDGKWQRPVSEKAIPAVIAPLVPQKECTAPACEKLWSIGQVELGGKPVAWAGAVNWLVTSGAAACDWKAETWSGVFIAGPDGEPKQVTEAQEQPLPLFAVLADGGGAKVVIVAGPGEYTAYDYANGAATVGRHLVWLRPHPDSFADLAQLGPECP